ncbi:Ig-like domain-containing protein [Pseudomonas sp. D(2018)]|uniref:Ig-like domain-containing protein n=1 Tax=Pseudomonas sp. D(2018) TaxID=2502238 RepID=UPI0010F6B0EA|nr:Ig-like domain-containing protein [Pseudomonas sp. D(2018)]
MHKWPVVLAMVLGFGAISAQAQLAAVDPGPYTAATGGFPLWYQDRAESDAAKLKLELCLSKALSSRAPGSYMCTLLPSPGIFDDTKPIAFPGNFPDESFWMLAEAEIDDPGNGIELEAYVAGIEAAFASEVPRQGDQQSFARIRIRVNVPVAGTYRVIHPYGVDTFNITAPGRRAINMTRDIGIGAPGDFRGAMAGNVGPFLVSRNGPYRETDPQTGLVETFIGDPNLTEQVIGSPFGTNFVRIEGPGGRVAQTNLFSLSGKVLSSRAGTSLEVSRASYSRSAERTWISVFGNSTAGANLCFRESIDLVGDPPSPCQFQMTGSGSGTFFGLDSSPASLPPLVVVTASDSSGVTAPTTLSQPLTDQVEISSARYVAADRTLTIEARSSDEVLVPVLAAEGFGALIRVAGSQQRLVAGEVAQPPAYVTVKSAAGGVDTEPVVVVGTPSGSANQSPVAVADAAGTAFGAPVTINVLANDSDPDGNVPLSIANLTQPASGSGSVTANGASVTYTPPAGLSGPLTATFSYQARDSLGALSAPASVTVTVAGNQPPTAGNDSASTTAPNPVTVNVLANDSDPEGGALTVASLTQPPAGQGSVASNGTSVTYTPPATLASPLNASFSYRAQDAQGNLSAVATVSVAVAPAQVPAETLGISSATVRATGGLGGLVSGILGILSPSARRYDWDISGTSSRPAGNSIRVEVTSSAGVTLLGTVTPAANGTWRVAVTNSSIAPSNNPSATARSAFGTVRTSPVVVR